ncbi:tetracycline resistance protein [Fusarium austroafricanum]|uniref:Tetracycline resistance protein n=1 Tax=Fusarium austroafricanum TaxID=2364996 RepID=A0A8H4KWV6_9HYPO|nr:tetracycline resistance protein [Fusarium austroafricanum]
MPYELRLQIWNAAYLPSKPDYCGLQVMIPFLTVDSDSWDGGASRLENIALEFDSIWNVGLPDYFYDLVKENFAWGVLADCLFKLACDLLSSEPLGLWVIDKSARWRSKSTKEPKTIYRDCGGEYVEVDWDDAYCGSKAGKPVGAKEFIEEFCMAYNDDSDEVYIT